MGEQIAFWISATLAVVGALGMVLSKKTVHSALWVANTMVNLAVLYALLNASFLAMVQIIVYTGAVMMLFLFVVMIIGVESSDSITETLKGQRWLAAIGAAGIGGLLVSAIGGTVYQEIGLTAANAEWGGNLQGLASLIFDRYLLAFEVTSALLITAAVGAMVLAHTERFIPRSSQRDLAIARFKGDGFKTSLPAPGTFALHNSVDTPALLPDGSIAENSIPRPLAARGTMRAIDTADQAAVSALSDGRPAITNTEDEA